MYVSVYYKYKQRENCEINQKASSRKWREMKKKQQHRNKAKQPTREMKWRKTKKQIYTANRWKIKNCEHFVWQLCIFLVYFFGLPSRFVFFFMYFALIISSLSVYRLFLAFFLFVCLFCNNSNLYLYTCRFIMPEFMWRATNFLDTCINKKNTLCALASLGEVRTLLIDRLSSLHFFPSSSYFVCFTYMQRETESEKEKWETFQAHSNHFGKRLSTTFHFSFGEGEKHDSINEIN